MADTPSDGRLVAGRYDLQTLIGRGGSAAVWHADDRELRRPVAVKHIVLGASGSTRSRIRAMREAQAVAKLRTPGVVQLYDVHEDGDQVYLIMELILAPSLSRLVRRRGAIDPAEAARIGRSVLRTLVAVHEAGIVHRDVKPSNVLVTDTGVYLTDFGIALLADDPTLTASGSVLGTPAYMAPEQAKGERVGPAADLYGLGATLYFAVEGCAPFSESGSVETTQAVRHQPHRPGRRLGSLESLVEALLAKDPAARPDVASVATALDVASSAPVGDAPPFRSGVVRDASAPPAGPPAAEEAEADAQPAAPPDAPASPPPTDAPPPATPPDTPAPATPTDPPAPATPTGGPAPATPTDAPAPATPPDDPPPSTPSARPPSAHPGGPAAHVAEEGRQLRRMVLWGVLLLVLLAAALLLLFFAVRDHPEAPATAAALVIAARRPTRWRPPIMEAAEQGSHTRCNRSTPSARSSSRAPWSRHSSARRWASGRPR